MREQGLASACGPASRSRTDIAGRLGDKEADRARQMRAEWHQGETQRSYGPGRLVAMLRDMLRRRLVYRRTLQELRSLSRRELEDKGIGPGMITRVAAEAAYGNDKAPARGRTRSSKD